MLLACSGPDDEQEPTPDRGAAPAVEPSEPTLRKLTQEQYEHTLLDLFGPELVQPTRLEPDEVVYGLRAVGAGTAALSPLGVEQYETAALSIASQVVEEPVLRDTVVPCEPADSADRACYEQFVGELGRLAWRRTLDEAEIAVLADIAEEAAVTLDDPWAGIEWSLVALLQSPHFLYRVELGDGQLYTGLEMASRLSYLLWDSTPDTELLDAAEAGELDTADGLAAQAQRMLDDPKARRGLRAFFDDMLELHELEDLTKDPTIFVHHSDEVGPSAREETLRGIEHIVFDLDGDYRDLLTTRTTFIDRTLAAIYEVPAPAREGFAKTELPATLPRMGLLGQVSTLAGHSHAVSTSVTGRGIFVRQKLLCHPIPPPPADVDTSIPEPDADAPTMRDRVAVHLEAETCASCHQITDPIGLGLENYDGIGRFRLYENDTLIDASGELDGTEFSNPLELAQALHDHPDLPACLTQTAYAYASGRVPTFSEQQWLDWHTMGFAAEGHRVRAMLEELVTSEAFATAGEVLP